MGKSTRRNRQSPLGKGEGLGVSDMVVNHGIGGAIGFDLGLLYLIRSSGIGIGHCDMPGR